MSARPPEVVERYRQAVRDGIGRVTQSFGAPFPTAAWRAEIATGMPAS